MKDIIDIELAIDLLDNNTTKVHKWFNVRNKVGKVFEIHGTSNDIEAIVEIEIEDEKTKIYIKEYEISTSRRRYPLKNDMSRGEFIVYISNSDFKDIKINTGIIMVEKKVYSVDLGL